MVLYCIVPLLCLLLANLRFVGLFLPSPPIHQNSTKIDKSTNKCKLNFPYMLINMKAMWCNMFLFCIQLYCVKFLNLCTHITFLKRKMVDHYEIIQNGYTLQFSQMHITKMCTLWMHALYKNGTLIFGHERNGTQHILFYSVFRHFYVILSFNMTFVTNTNSKTKYLHVSCITIDFLDLK